MTTLSTLTINSLSLGFDKELLCLMLGRCGKENRLIVWGNIEKAWSELHNHKEQQLSSCGDLVFVDVPDDYPDYFDELRIYGEGIGEAPFSLSPPWAEDSDFQTEESSPKKAVALPSFDIQNKQAEEIKRLKEENELLKKNIADLKAAEQKLQDSQPRAYEEQIAERAKTMAFNLWRTNMKNLQVVVELFAKMNWEKQQQEIEHRIEELLGVNRRSNYFAPGSTAQVINGDVHDSKIG